MPHPMQVVVSTMNPYNSFEAAFCIALPDAGKKEPIETKIPPPSSVQPVCLRNVLRSVVIGYSYLKF
jgi:hypothetical protein